jgi:hypothetical protein
MPTAHELVAAWLATRPSYATAIGRPLPLDTWAFQLTWKGIVFTSVARKWRPGTTGPGGECRRCNVCLAARDHCILAAPILLPPEGLRDFAPFLDHGIVFEGPGA